MSNYLVSLLFAQFDEMRSGRGFFEIHPQKGRYRAYFLEPPTFSSSLMSPASIAAVIACDTLALLLSGR